MKDCVRVKWIDSCASNSEWILGSDIKDCGCMDPIKIFTYGFLIKEDKDYVVIAQNYGVNPEQYCNLMSIPRGCILSIDKIDRIS